MRWPFVTRTRMESELRDLRNLHDRELQKARRLASVERTDLQNLIAQITKLIHGPQPQNPFTWQVVFQYPMWIFKELEHPERLAENIALHVVQQLKAARTK